MSRTIQLMAIALFLSVLGSAPALATTVWDEAVNGDLSTDPAVPTALAFSKGSNVVIGSVQSFDDTRDVLTFAIDPGLVLREIVLVRYEDLDTGGDGDTGYNLIGEGVGTVIPDISNVDQFLGGNHVDSGFVGTDLLENLAGAPLGGTGFTPPLGAGAYTYLIQQTGLEHTGYTLDFVVGPEPSTAALLGLAACGLVVATRRRAR